MGRVITLQPGQTLSETDAAAVAAAALQAKAIVFPTDTVYGIGSTGLIKAAVRRLYELKARDAMKPLPILIDSAEAAKRWVEWTPAAEALASRFWPGPLTLVLKPTKEGRLLTFPEFPTLAIRVPAHPVALQILRAAAGPLAVTSANRSGEPAISSGAQAARAFGDAAEFVVDAGEAGGQESTLVDATGVPVRVLREGALSRQRILEAVPA
ncbi:MAG: L-threonylcarbamoyladenylate synthase [Elusimicrobia bacterium]|nr:L-threonylcarbamoyladenylate synthase [Elusimicrobiota bacterium]